MKKEQEKITEPEKILHILDLDHPGAHDPEYRLRREKIAELARTFRKDPATIPIVQYTENENSVWRDVNEILSDLHPDTACSRYLYARKRLDIPQDHIPQMRDLNNRVRRFNRMQLGPVEGLVDSRSFLSSLGDGRMLCTQYIRHHSRPTFTPEPDAIHEFIGHVPMFADKDLVEFSKLIGIAARTASDEQLVWIERLYWFTLEYGLIEENGEPKAFGAGLLAGIEDLQNAFKSEARILDFDIETVINTPYNYSFLQDEYFIIPSFEFLKRQTEVLIKTLAKQHAK
jgi:phenylalanine-4-hydroxylase